MRIEIENAAAARALRPLRILVVEDHDDTRWGLTRWLTHCGYEPIVVRTAAEALALPAGSFDIAVIDLMLDCDAEGGVALLHLLNQRHGAIPAIAFSVRGSSDDVDECQRAGFRYHVLKPDVYRLDMLLHQIAQSLLTQPADPSHN